MNTQETIHAILNEPSNSFDVLMIIAGEANLRSEDRQSIREAADQMQAAYRQLVYLNFKLTEQEHHNAALAERLVESEREAQDLRAKVRELQKPRWSMSTGWIPVEQLPCL